MSSSTITIFFAISVVLTLGVDKVKAFIRSRVVWKGYFPHQRRIL
jgi:hypothetical protein